MLHRCCQKLANADPDKKFIPAPTCEEKCACNECHFMKMNTDNWSEKVRSETACAISKVRPQGRWTVDFYPTILELAKTKGEPQKSWKAAALCRCYRMPASHWIERVSTGTPHHIERDAGS